MIKGIHFLLYTTNADADRAFLRDVLGLKGVDAGGGWLILRLPPGEIAVHPSGENLVLGGETGGLLGAQTFFITDDVDAAVRTLSAKGVACDPIGEAEWGRFTGFALPSGGRLGLYQPKHRMAIDGA